MKSRAGALFRPEITLAMALQCLESQQGMAGHPVGANRGVAYESDLLVVKMKNADKNSFPRTTELMEGVDYLIRQAIRLGRPIAVNISFGNNYGSHKRRFFIGNLFGQCVRYGQKRDLYRNGE